MPPRAWALRGDETTSIIHGIAAFALAIAAACGPVTDVVRLPPLDASATFAAHSTHGGFAIDRLEATTGRIDARSFGTFVLRADGTGALVLRLTAPATVVARAGTSSAAPVIAWVEPAWQEQAIRLTLTTDAGLLHVGPFVRIDGRAGMPVLARTGQTTLDARGTFRAEVTGNGGEPRGWFEVRVPSPDEPRVFTAALPRTPLEAGPALTLALASELDWIENHSLDVYRGQGRGRSGDHGR